MNYLLIGFLVLIIGCSERNSKQPDNDWRVVSKDGAYQIQRYIRSRTNWEIYPDVFTTKKEACEAVDFLTIPLPSKKLQIAPKGDENNVVYSK